MSLFHSSRQLVPHAAQESLDGAVGVLRGAQQEHTVTEEAAAVTRHVRVSKPLKYFESTLNFGLKVNNIVDLILKSGNPCSCNLPEIPLLHRPLVIPLRPSSSRWTPTPP